MMSRGRVRQGGRLPALLMLLVAATAGGADQPVEEQQPAVEPQAQIEELTLRLLGMEGKLKESAHARKTADQARMEAERRLAEGAREIERLDHEMQRLKERQRELEQALADRDQRLTQIAAQLLSLNTSNESLNRRFEALRARVPIQDGGSLGPEEAKQAAGDAYRTLREIVRGSGTTPSPELRKAILAAETTLHQRQLTLARAADAQGVYRVRANDSLALISSRCTGDSALWRTLFEANRHVLDDPDQLMPGVTLVIP
jgi:nucleoid-associated protein YgaU